MIYDNLKKICKDRKIPLRRVEAELGFSNGTIFKWNKSVPSVERVRKVAEYLSVDINELIGDNKDAG